jgi:hypothetical protein
MASSWGRLAVGRMLAEVKLNAAAVRIEGAGRRLDEAG